MGSTQSKPTPELVLHEKAVLERLQSMEEDFSEVIEGDEEFVHIGHGIKGGVRLRREAEVLPVELLGSWQSKVLHDPKNRSVYSIALCISSIKASQLTFFDT